VALQTHWTVSVARRLFKLNQSELEFGAKRRHKKKQTNDKHKHKRATRLVRIVSDRH